MMTSFIWMLCGRLSQSLASGRLLDQPIRSLLTVLLVGNLELGLKQGGLRFPLLGYSSLFALPTRLEA
jgi:hypothetical protein